MYYVHTPRPLIMMNTRRKKNSFFSFVFVLLGHGGHGFLGIDDLDEGVALLARLAHVHGGVSIVVLDRSIHSGGD